MILRLSGQRKQWWVAKTPPLSLSSSSSRHSQTSLSLLPTSLFLRPAVRLRSARDSVVTPCRHANNARARASCYVICRLAVRHCVMPPGRHPRNLSAPSSQHGHGTCDPVFSFVLTAERVIAWIGAAALLLQDASCNGRGGGSPSLTE